MLIDKILLVDDDKISNHISEMVIQSASFAKEIIVKTDGKQGLDYLLEECKSEDSVPELILLDLKMPSMDGFEFLEQFEKSCKHLYRHVVIVILTTSKNGDDIIQLRRLGNYYLMHKPITHEKLMDVYHRYFRNKQVG